MKLGSIAFALLAGGIFGAAISLVNDISSPYGAIGAGLAGTILAAAQVLSLLIGQGWAWAGLAILMGFLVRGSVQGAVVGVLSLLAATLAYYVMDSVLLEKPLYWYAILYWWVASVIFGSVLGLVGAKIRRPEVIGLLAGLTLPVGATINMIWLLEDPTTPPPTYWAQGVAWVAAAIVSGIVIVRFVSGLRPGSNVISDQS